MRTTDFAKGFFGRMPGRHGMSDMHEKWAKMTIEEKQAFIDERMNNKDFGHGKFFGERKFDVEEMDKRCEDWLKKTPEEKEEFIKEQKEMHGKFFGRFGHFGHGAGGHENCMHEVREKWSKMTPEEKQEFIRKREEAMHERHEFFNCFFSKKEESDRKDC
jgi:predicted Fe-S protein YdhL (DUF1289 family)